MAAACSTAICLCPAASGSGVVQYPVRRIEIDVVVDHPIAPVAAGEGPEQRRGRGSLGRDGCRDGRWLRRWRRRVPGAGDADSQAKDGDRQTRRTKRYSTAHRLESTARSAGGKIEATERATRSEPSDRPADPGADYNWSRTASARNSERNHNAGKKSRRSLIVACLFAVTSPPPFGAFERGAQRHAQRDAEADVVEGGSHGDANRHADGDARAWR